MEMGQKIDFLFNFFVLILVSIDYSVKRSDVTGNPVEWLFGEDNIT